MSDQKQCDHASFPDGRCKEPAQYVILTLGYPTWSTCAQHLESRVNVMTGANGYTEVRQVRK